MEGQKTKEIKTAKILSSDSKSVISTQTSPCSNLPPRPSAKSKISPMSLEGTTLISLDSNFSSAVEELSEENFSENKIIVSDTHVNKNFKAQSDDEKRSIKTYKKVAYLNKKKKIKLNRDKKKLKKLKRNKIRVLTEKIKELEKKYEVLKEVINTLNEENDMIINELKKDNEEKDMIISEKEENNRKLMEENQIIDQLICELDDSYISSLELIIKNKSLEADLGNLKIENEKDYQRFNKGINELNEIILNNLSPSVCYP